jgi:hypothetical protein
MAILKELTYVNIAAGSCGIIQGFNLFSSDSLLQNTSVRRAFRVKAETTRLIALSFTEFHPQNPAFIFFHAAASTEEVNLGSEHSRTASVP